MLERFLQYLQFEKRYSFHTVNSYKIDLEQFSSYLRDNYNTDRIQGVSSDMIRSWFVYLLSQGKSARTVNRKKTSLNTFFIFLRKNDLLAENPLSKVQSPKTSKRLPTFIEEKSLLNLLDNFPTEGKNHFLVQRDRLIIEMFYATGIRLTELVNLKESDVNLFDSHIKVLGKRNKERIIPFNSHLKKIIENYLQVKSDFFLESNAENCLFVTRSGKKIYQRLVHDIVRSYLGLITTQEKKSPHTLRHTFATHLLDHGANLNSIKELLGHANLSATQIYTHNSIDKLKSLYKQAHPKA